MRSKHRSILSETGVSNREWLSLRPESLSTTIKPTAAILAGGLPRWPSRGPDMFLYSPPELILIAERCYRSADSLSFDDKCRGPHPGVRCEYQLTRPEAIVVAISC